MVKTIDFFVNKIFIADSAFLLKNIPDNSIDIIITSPPYNFGMEYDQIDDSIDFDDYFEKLYPIWKECYRILKVGGRIAVNIKPLYSKHVNTHHQMTALMKKAGFLWRTEFVWNTRNFNCAVTEWGSYASPSNNNIRFKHEFIEVFDKVSRKKEIDNPLSLKYSKNELIDITKDEFEAWTEGIWDISPQANMKKMYGHPAVFPEEIPERLMKLYSYVGDIVLDPFNGSGTTTKVAYAMKRRCIGIDISPEYCKTAIKRISPLQNSTSLIGGEDDGFFQPICIVNVERNDK